MTVYGLPYKGSKNAIAEWIVSKLPAADTLVDLFCGGGAVAHAAAVSGRFKTVVLNDISPSALAFAECVNGDMAGYSTVMTREEFIAAADDDFLGRLLHSFGNNGKTYLWGNGKDAIKAAASEMVLKPSVHERRVAYRRFMRLLREYGGMPDCDRGHDGNLESLESLERLERTESLERIETAELRFSRADYAQVGIPGGAAVYADIPYKGTDCGQYGGFDHERFERWLSCVPFMVVVSEYTCPAGCIEVASTEKRVLSAASGNTAKSTERLFVQERFEGEYRERMAEGRLF